VAKYESGEEEKYGERTITDQGERFKKKPSRGHKKRKVKRGGGGGVVEGGEKGRGS